jgi:hypothetical protein
MPRCLLRITTKEKSYYCEWSTVVDSPVSPLFPTVEQFKDWYESRYPNDHDFEERMMRVVRNGTSFEEPTTAEELIRGNRAGKNESELSKKELVEDYA